MYEVSNYGTLLWLLFSLTDIGLDYTYIQIVRLVFSGISIYVFLLNYLILVCKLFIAVCWRYGTSWIFQKYIISITLEVDIFKVKNNCKVFCCLTLKYYPPFSWTYSVLLFSTFIENPVEGFTSLCRVSEAYVSLQHIVGWPRALSCGLSLSLFNWVISLYNVNCLPNIHLSNASNYSYRLKLLFHWEMFKLELVASSNECPSVACSSTTYRIQ